jgi:hypothetical protein
VPTRVHRHHKHSIVFPVWICVVRVAESQRCVGGSTASQSIVDIVHRYYFAARIAVHSSALQTLTHVCTREHYIRRVER